MIYNYFIYQSFLYGVNNNKAFSLIELSIVLIIIGLLVAGITGGQSLIESAKNRAVVNEIRGWKQAVNAFYLLKERLPGDLNNDGKVGYGSNETYNKNSFPFPYNGTDNNYSIPDVFSAPFVDLYLAKITTFKPTKANKSFNVAYFYSTLGGTEIPILKNLKNYVIHFEYIQNGGNFWLKDIQNQQFLGVRTDDSAEGLQLQTSKIFQYVDQKMDDGRLNSGSIRSSCDRANKNGLGYEEIINQNKKCLLMFIKI